MVMQKEISKDDDISFIVRDIITYKLGLDESQIINTANLHDDLGIDSLDIIELQMELEKKLDIKISDEEGEQLKTVGQIIHFIKNKKQF
jgi:acyl carrier protein